MLITSRDRHAALDLLSHHSNLIEVKEMSEEEAIDLFQKKTAAQHHNRVRMRRLAQQLDCIPLAITQAAAYIMQDVRMDIPRYLERIQDIGRSDSLLTTSLNDVRRDLNVHNAVIKTWEISFSRIKEQDERAANLLCTMAFFDKHEIPELLLLRYPGSRENIADAIDTLIRFGFLRQTTTPLIGRDAYETHRLVQLATKAWSHANRSMEQFAMQALEMVDLQYGDNGFDDWQVCRVLEPHAESLNGILMHLWSPQARGNGPGHLRMDDHARTDLAPWISALVRSKMLRGQLSYKRSMYAYQHGNIQKALLLGRLAKNDFQQVHGKDDVRTLACGALIARSCLASRDRQTMTEAVSIGEDTVQRQTNLLGAEHVNTLTTRAHLAMIYKWQDKPKEAVRVLTEVIAAFSRMAPSALAQDDTYRSLVMAMNDLSVIHGDCGEWTEAERLQTTAFQHLRRVRGDSHPEVLNMQANLARSKMRLGQLEEATRMLEEVVRVKQRVLRPDHYELIGSMSTLAMAYEKQGKLQEARQLFDTVVERSKSILGEDNPSTIQRTIALAMVQRAEGDLEDALETVQPCVALILRREGAQSPDYIWTVQFCRQLRKERNLAIFNQHNFLDRISRFTP